MFTQTFHPFSGSIKLRTKHVWEQGVVWTAPCGAPGATVTGEMVHNWLSEAESLLDVPLPSKKRSTAILSSSEEEIEDDVAQSSRSKFYNLPTNLPSERKKLDATGLVLTILKLTGNADFKSVPAVQE
jgi:hypothetical protein